MNEILFSPPDIREEDVKAVVEVLKSGWITTGPKTKLFESEIARFCTTAKTICLNSATAGLELILRVLGIGKGDEVITSAYTYTASASVIEHVGATPVLIDVAPNSYHLDINSLNKAITSKTKAIIAVDIGGVMCDYDEIFEVVSSKKHLFKPTNLLQHTQGRVAVIADAAHSLGAWYQGIPSGKVADFSSFSFHAVKNITTGEGGAVTWKSQEGVDDDSLYKEIMLLALHGQNKDALTKAQIGAWEYDITRLGYKWNMTDIAAALGSSQLKRYPAILARRARLTECYDQFLKEMPVRVLKHKQEKKISSFHLYLLNLVGKSEKERNDIIKGLAEKGVAVNVHYKPLPMFSAYQKMGFEIKDYPNAYEMYKSEITLPLHTLLKEEETAYVVKSLKQLL